MQFRLQFFIQKRLERSVLSLGKQMKIKVSMSAEPYELQN